MLSSLLSNDRQSMDDLKNSVSKLGNTMNVKKLKENNYEINGRNGSFAKTTKFSRLLGGRGGSCSGGSGTGVTGNGGSTAPSNSNVQKNLAVNAINKLSTNLSNKENVSALSNIRESSSKEFNKRKSNTFKNGLSSGFSSKENLGASTNYSKKPSSLNSTTKAIFTSTLLREKHEPEHYAHGSRDVAHTHQNHNHENTREHGGNKRPSNDSSYSSIRNKKRNPSYISTKFTEILNSSKVGASSNKIKGGINWHNFK